jgi:LytS/YehU family sensor histidine kinase
MGGMTALSCMISTIVEGLLGGLVHSILIKRGRTDRVFNPLTAGAITCVAELTQMLIILLIARPYESALHLVQSIAAPMMVTNTVGAALFMRILLDKRAMFEKYTSAFSATALKVAASTEGILRQGFNEENSMKVAQVLYKELDIGAVAITDREKLLAFTGTGTTIIFPAGLSRPSGRKKPSKVAKWCMPMVMRCRTAARCIHSANWVQRWSFHYAVKTSALWAPSNCMKQKPAL